MDHSTRRDMTSPSSIFKPKLKDQDYMELVFENGQILAKSQRSNVYELHNQRTNSIMDLYEAEYRDDFNKSTIKNLQDTLVVPEHHRSMMQENNKHVDLSSLEFIPSDEQSMVAEKSVELDFTYSSIGFTQDNSLDDDDQDSDDQARTSTSLVKRKRTSKVYNSPERQQENIDKKMRTLQNLLPNSHKDDNELLLDQAINYMTSLQHQVQMMTMGNGYVTPSMMLLPMGPHYSHMGMQMGVPQFLPMTVSGGGLPGMTPGGVPLQNSLLFTPMEYHSSCAASLDQVPTSQGRE